MDRTNMPSRREIGLVQISLEKGHPVTALRFGYALHQIGIGPEIGGVLALPLHPRIDFIDKVTQLAVEQLAGISNQTRVVLCNIKFRQGRGNLVAVCDVHVCFLSIVFFETNARLFNRLCRQHVPTVRRGLLTAPDH